MIFQHISDALMYFISFGALITLMCSVVIILIWPPTIVFRELFRWLNRQSR